MINKSGLSANVVRHDNDEKLVLLATTTVPTKPMNMNSQRKQQQHQELDILRG